MLSVSSKIIYRVIDKSVLTTGSIEVDYYFFDVVNKIYVY